MTWERTAFVSLILLGLVIWSVPLVLAEECDERIAEANTLIGEAEQALARGGATANRAAMEAKLKTAKALVDEALTLHNSNAHEASVEKAYAALAAVKEVLKELKP